MSFPELGLGDIEIVQPHHRYLVCWPSMHPEGRRYRWRDPEGRFGGIPPRNDLPALPAGWIEGLRITARSLDTSNYDVRAALTGGQASAMVQARFGQAIKELNLPGQSRHDTALRHVLALLRMGKNGEPGVEAILVLLRKVFIAITVADGSRNPDEAREEFDRMVTGSGCARELAQPGILDWMRRRPAVASPTGLDTAGSAMPELPPGVPSVTAPPAARPVIESIEAGFWDTRESLNQVYTTAMARMCSPWAVLGRCAARALSQVRPNVVLPDLIGGPGSLNWFGAVVARSGGGKGAAAQCARVLVPNPDLIERNVGSGEGIIAAYGRTPTDGEPSEFYESVMFNADEVDTLAALNSRTASTMLPILRSGFSGETLGFSYAAKDKRRHIPAGSYRMTLMLSVQPARAGWLLTDANGGTPQRFMWFPGTDSRIQRDRPWPSGPLDLPPPGAWQYPRTIELPPEAEDLILTEHVRRQRDDAAALDGHALFCRLKFAYALTVLDNRVEMTAEDWQLSGIAAAVSAWVRGQTLAAIEEAAHDEALERGGLRGVELHAADLQRLREGQEQVERRLAWIVRKLDEAGPDGLTTRALANKDNARSRPYHESALALGVERGLLRHVDGTTTWVRA